MAIGDSVYSAISSLREELLDAQGTLRRDLAAGQDSIRASLASLAIGHAKVEANQLLVMQRLDKINGSVAAHAALVPLHTCALGKLQDEVDTLAAMREKMASGLEQRLGFLESQRSQERAIAEQEVKDKGSILGHAANKAIDLAVNGVVLLILYILVQNVVPLTSLIFGKH